MTSATNTSVSYREKVWPPISWWIVAAALSAMTAGMVYPVWATGAVIVPIVIFAAVVLWLRSASPTLLVTDQEFLAGPAHIERRFITGAEAMDPAESFLARGAQLDARAFLVIRPWVKTVVKVTIDDPQDPTPYWLVSSKQPARLAAALQQ
ncbi:DUF3093 domain-containing protein [Brevibacterium daeguense]|uniref:DUF3093 domain-containing protein n=1 Tax=Brevibacterium daeguense TaxID=909936 RepID=A0ABP8EMT6_9MICO|nr:DUF3093 domain-containing protein [Brevibacterium daeguense]